MRIRTQLSLLILLTILTATAIAVSMVKTDKDIDNAIRTSKRAQEISSNVAMLYRLSSELTPSNHARVSYQWAIKMRELENLLASLPPDITITSPRITNQKELADLAFQENVRAYKEENLNTHGGNFRSAQYFSRNHLAVVLGDLIFGADIIAQAGYSHIEMVKTKRNTMLIMFAAIGIAFLGGWMVRFWHNFMTPIRAMLVTIGEVATGNMNQRVTNNGNGELSTLVTSFNGMLDRLKELTVSRKSLLDVTEQERCRIGRDLHDGIQQTLIGIRLKIETMTMEDNERQTEVCNHLRHAQQEIQRIVKDLRPAMLDDLGLIATLHWFAEQNSNGRTISIDTDLEEKDIPHTLRTPIYRIVQEATANAFQHGKARTIHIQMNKEDNALNLFIEDDGKGFVMAPSRTGTGLINIQERVRAEDGEITIDTAPGRGCCIVSTFPGKKTS